MAHDPNINDGGGGSSHSNLRLILLSRPANGMITYSDDIIQYTPNIGKLIE